MTKHVCPSCKVEWEEEDGHTHEDSPETARFDVRGKLDEYDQRLAKLEAPPEAPAAEAAPAEAPAPAVGVKRGIFKKLDEILDD